MSTKNRVFSRLFDSSKHTAELKKAETKLNAKKKVALGLVNELLVDIETLSDNTDLLAYFTDDWFDEKFDEWRQLGREIYDVYYNNSETLIEPADVDTDRNTLEEIKQKAEELGLSVEDVYPEYEDHIFNLDYLDEKHEKFLQNKDLFKIESNV